MNILFHFLLNYLFIDAIWGNALGYVALIFVFSVLIDVTHLPYIIRVKGKIFKNRFGSASRTKFHEIYGLTLFSVIACLLYFLVNYVIVEIAMMCLVLHFAIDFLAGKSMPFYPFSKKEVFLGILPYEYKNKILFEIASTLLLVVLLWLRLESLVL
jgi:hypothetical protein